jgi:UDP-2,3-diacylglucosamine pyrophosphatase LpxH
MTRNGVAAVSDWRSLGLNDEQLMLAHLGDDLLRVAEAAVLLRAVSRNQLLQRFASFVHNQACRWARLAYSVPTLQRR